jgi:predicted nuclease with TOPRIM domain
VKEGKCIMGEMRKDREKITDTSVLIDTYEKEIWKLKQLLSRALQDTNTLEGTKRIVIDLSKEKIELRTELDRVKKENNDLYNRIADALEVNESHQKLNGKLQERLTELEEENKKMHDHLDRQVDNARKSGM